MKPIHRLSILSIVVAISQPLAAQWTWNGASGPSWTNTANWNPASVPAAGANITIANSTTNSVGSLNGADRTIGSLTFGSTGTRATGFTINTLTNALIIGGGIVANGDLTANNVALTMRGNFIVSANQEWSVGGSSNGDNGVFLRGTSDSANATPTGSVTLNANLTKTGTGQLLFASTHVSGAGNLSVDAGTLKINAGVSQPVIVAGAGNLTMNGSSILHIVKNSGTLNVTRPIAMNGTSTLMLRTATVDVASAIAVNGTNTLDLNNTSNLTGAWTGSGTFNRMGSGTLNLNGDLAGFGGALNLTTGTNNIAGAFGGSLGVTGGATTLGGAVGGSLSVSGGTLNGEVTATGDMTLSGGTISANPLTAESLGTTGNLNLSGTTTVVLGANPASTSPFTVLSYSGSLTGGAANLTLAGGAASYRSFAFDDTTHGIITLAVGSASRTWSGAAGELWDVNTTANWQEGDQKFFQLDTVTFGDTGAGNVAVTGTLMPGSITVNSSSDYTFTAAAGNSIAGATGLTKSGGGVLNLGGVNSFTGNIALNGGILKPTGNQALGANGNTITIAPGATLDANGSMNANRNYHAIISGDGVDALGAIVNSGGSHNNGVGALTLAADATIGGSGRWDVRPTGGPGLLDLAGHTLTKEGGNKIGIVDSVVTADGSIIVNGGNLAITRSTVSGDGTVTVNNAATLHIENQTTGSFSKNIVMNGATLQASGGPLIPVTSPQIAINDFEIFQMDSDLTFTGDIAGPGSINKNGSAALILAGAATHTGDTYISTGTLQIGNGGATGSITGDVYNYGTLSFNRSDTYQFSGGIEGSGSVSKQGAGTLILSGDSHYTGETVVSAGALVVKSASALGDTFGLVRFTGSTGVLELAPATTVQPYPFTIGAGSSGTILAGVATPGPGINHTLGDFSLSTITLNVGAGADVIDGDPRITIPNLSLDAGATGNTTLNPSSAAITLGNAAIGGGNFAKTLVLGGTHQGNLLTGVLSDGINTLSLTKNNAGTWTLSGDSTFTGNVTVNDGVLAITHGNALGAPAKALNIYGEASENRRPELRLSGGIPVTLATIQTSGAGIDNAAGVLRNISGNNTLTVTEQISMRTGVGATTLYSDAGTFTINTPLITATAAGRQLFVAGPGSGVINGEIANGSTANLPVTKNGSGTWALNGAHTYTGTTTVNEGTLSLGQAALSDVAAVVIGENGKLHLNFAGSDRVGSLTINGDTKPDGLYDSTTDPGFITGTGSIRVGPEPSGYGTWASGFPFDVGVNDGPNDDPDGDGIGNLLEYALGGVPVGAGAGDTSILPDQSLTATDLVLTFHRSDSSETDVTLKVQWSGDMDTWTDFATIGPASSLPEVVVTEDSPAAGLDTVVVTIPRGLAPGGKLFARLQAVK